MCVVMTLEFDKDLQQLIVDSCLFNCNGDSPPFDILKLVVLLRETKEIQSNQIGNNVGAILASLMAAQERHLSKLIAWEYGGYSVFDGLSENRRKEWLETDDTLKFLRYATKLMNELMFIPNDSSDINLASKFFLIDDENCVLDQSMIHTIWLLALVDARNKRLHDECEFDRKLPHLVVKGMLSLDLNWLCFEHHGEWIEQTIEFSGSEWLINPVIGKFESLAGLIEYQNTMCCSNLNGPPLIRPPPLTIQELFIGVFYKVLLKTIIPSDYRNDLSSVPSSLWEIHKIFLKDANSATTETFGSIRITVESLRMIMNEPLSEDCVPLLLKSIEYQPDNYLTRFLLAKTIYSRQNARDCEATITDHLDYLNNQFTMAENAAIEIDGEDAAMHLSPRANSIFIMTKEIVEQMDVEGAAWPGERVEVLWTVHPDDGGADSTNSEDVFYGGVVRLGVLHWRDNTLNVLYDDDSDKEVIHRIQFLDGENMLYLNENCEMIWRFEDSTTVMQKVETTQEMEPIVVDGSASIIDTSSAVIGPTSAILRSSLHDSSDVEDHEMSSKKNPKFSKSCQPLNRK